MRGRSSCGAVILGLTLASASCGGDKNGGLTAPSSSSEPSRSSSPAARETSSAPASVSLSAASGGAIAAAVTFPPRNEPLDFGNQLNSLYQTTLRRGPVSTFVDLEGYIVWIQEYLRYRVNGCSHQDAISRVISQINSAGVAPVCTEAPAGAVAFPPRDQSLDFGSQLNALYRDTLRRSAVPTFVDLEGWIVWIQEYLRYRVNGCAHADAVSRVFTQINGGGIQPVCSSTPTTNVAGTWRGSVFESRCSSSGGLSITVSGLPFCTAFNQRTYPITFSLSQSGTSLSGNLDLDGELLTLTGSVQGNRLQLSGTGSLRTNSGDTLRYTITQWDTSVSGTSMSGTFEIATTVVGLAGAYTEGYELRNVAKSSSSQPTPTLAAGGDSGARADALRALRAGRER